MIDRISYLSKNKVYILSVLSIVVMGGTIERIDDIGEISRCVEDLGCGFAKWIEGDRI
jgi:hypothetical protein